METSRVSESPTSMPPPWKPAGGPVQAPDRVVTLDVIRGMAILGILMVNMQSFSMPTIVHDNPMAYGDMTGLEFTIWHGMHLLFEGKFHTIFAALFGAGMVLMLDRARDAGRLPLGLHYRRMLGLLIIGMIHAYLIWFGDILVSYALCGCVVVLLRNLRSRWLVPIGAAMIAVPALLCLSVYGMVVMAPQYATPALMEEWWPSAESLAEEVAAYQGPWTAQLLQRAVNSLTLQTIAFGAVTFWRAGGMMLLGMVLYRSGVLSGARSTRFYAATMVVAGAISIALAEWGVRANMAHAWDPTFALPFGIQFNYWGSLFGAMAWVCALVLLARVAWAAWLTSRLAAVGRTALSNYLMQSLICTFIFYGHGLGWYGETPRTMQLALVIAIWCAQLIVSPMWLRAFRFGPAEYMWRWFTYGRRPVLRVTPRTTVEPTSAFSG